MALNDRLIEEVLSGLAQPARRALDRAGIVRLSQLATMREHQIQQLHGIGPRAFAEIKRVMKREGLSFNK